MASTGEQALHDYYRRGEEIDRLLAPAGVIELERTKEVVLRDLPPPPATVADIGGGPGRYALWLAGLGYKVLHRDLVPLHVAQLAELAGATNRVETAVADARHLDIADGQVDALLLLGPLYHLEHRADRLRALSEARRVLRPGGVLFAAAISRWTRRLHGVLWEKLYERFPEALAKVADEERTGRIAPLHESAFCGYSHRPRQLRSELTSAGFEVVDLVGVEGPSLLLGDLGERLADERAREVVFETARALERVPEVLGASCHLLATGRA